MEIINSVADLANALAKLGEPAPEHTRFFRGHGNKEWSLIPSIYRRNSLIANESNIIKDAFIYCPNDFSPNDTLFEKLVKLQHYGYPTRLLDLTSNILVAFYFAASSEQDREGEIIVLDIPNESLKYSDDDYVSILSSLSLMEYCFEINFAIQYAEASGRYAKMQKEIELKDTYKNMPSNLESIMKNGFEIKKENAYKDAFIAAFNNDNHIISLLSNAREDKPSLNITLTPKDLSKILCVRAKMNNPRILHQQGCFLLFGIDTKKNEPAKFDNSWVINGKSIIVPCGSKSNILRELCYFGISKQILFPELDEQVKDIVNKYERKDEAVFK